MGDRQSKSDKPLDNKGSIDRRIASAIMDCPEIMEKLSRLGLDNTPIVEIQAELPSVLDTDIILGMVNRWCDLATTCCKPVRVYGWSYNEKVEDYVQTIVAKRSNVYVTVLPYYLREVKRYA